MMAIKTIAFTLLAFLVLVPSSYANNLQLKNLNVVSSDTASETMTFSFDLTQENSWRTNTNNTISYDAVWVFMKYSTDGGITWKHGTMNGSGVNPAGFYAPANFQIEVPVIDQKGFFLHRSDFGSGNIAPTGIKFVWNYHQDGLTTAVAEASNTIHKIFGIEMVYIPTGAFYAGDGDSSAEFHLKAGSADNTPWYIQSETGFMTTNTPNGGYYYVSTGATGEYADGAPFQITNDFPKGYNAFYLMKYELTEGQWVSFFNTLSNAAKVNRDITTGTGVGGKASDGVVNRNTIAWDHLQPSLPATTLRPSRPVSYVSWPDVAAYAAWAGLRPMTELEFEKAARGKGKEAIADEFAWGNTSYSSANPSDIDPNADENGTETILTGSANFNGNSSGFTSGDGRPGGPADGQVGPLRSGIFASALSNRNKSGAGFYGNMELSGNLYEPVVTIGRTQGLSFLGSHGNGELTSASGYEGFASNSDWPGYDSAHGVVDHTKGIGYRGGDFKSSLRAFEISSRTNAAKDPDTQGCLQRYDSGAGCVGLSGVFYGGRLARTAP